MEPLVASAKAALGVLPWLGVFVGLILIVLSGTPPEALSPRRRTRQMRLRAIGIGLAGVSIGAVIMRLV